MPNSDIDYSNTIIYKITCKNKDITDVYVGHTTNFVQRRYAHKQGCINNKSANHNCKLYNVIRANGGWSNWHMEIINFFNCADHCDARKKEQEYFIELKATLNSIEPFPKKEEKINTIDNETPIVPDSPYRFVCEPCGIKTNNKKDYNKHCLTAKHINRTSVEQPPLKVGFSCKRCNKIYNARNSLWYHEQKCDDEKKQKLYINQENAQVSQLTNMVFELIKSNSDLQKQMLEFYKNINTEI